VKEARVCLSTRRLVSKYPKHKRNLPNILQGGVAHCKCGYRIGPNEAAGKTRTLHYYRCNRVTAGKCDTRNIDANRAEMLVWKTFIETLSDPEALKKSILGNLKPESQVDIEQKLKVVEKQIAALAMNRERLNNIYRTGRISESDWETESADLDGQLKNLVSQQGILIKQQRTPEALDKIIVVAAQRINKQLEGKRTPLGPDFEIHIEMARQIQKILRNFVACGGRIQIWKNTGSKQIHCRITGALNASNGSGGGGGSAIFVKDHSVSNRKLKPKNFLSGPAPVIRCNRLVRHLTSWLQTP